ncbi:hypothetical protein E3N88_23058 [Mikania micrantha]|uniref:Uncharacterized protein n=1 Tax=Mikania micrantha TaxID=192012 RepID=A0A5N6NDX8_9ASTR|nr:hypothetical protein E3N88_23058 [Mikania micrantha]
MGSSWAPDNSGLTYVDFDILHRSINSMFIGCVEEVGCKEGQDEADLTEVFDENIDGFISARRRRSCRRLWKDTSFDSAREKSSREVS